jgi:hypothetical protein
MDSVRYLEPSERQALASLFTHHRHLRPNVDAVLQGYCGIAVANPGSKAQVAQLTISYLNFFGGDPTHPLARHLVERLPGKIIIVVANATWRDLVFRVHGARLTIQTRLSFSSTSLRLAHLQHLMSCVPAGFHIKRIDLDLAQRIGAEVDTDLILPEVFPSPTDFVERGIGFCALAGERIVCGATSAAKCDNAIEIQINTNPPYRRMGLASAVGATLVSHCLEYGLDPDWDTATTNLPSQNLAQKLGYIPESTYEWLVLPA